MIWLYISAGVLAAVLGITFGAYLYTFFGFDRNRDCFALPTGERYRRAEKMRPHIKAVQQRPISEEIYIPSFDGVMLYGRYYHVRDGAPIHIEMHGYKGTAYRDFCGGNRIAEELGHNSLLIDQRAHGKSGGRTIAFGEKEKYDCKKWAEYLYKRFPDSPVLLVGVSMGGATVLAAGEIGLPANVCGIVADCPYAASEEIIRYVCGVRGIPPTLAMPFVHLAARLFGGFKLRRTPVGNTTLPVCIIHGLADTFVPPRMSERVVQSYPENKERHTFEGAAHGMSFVTDMDRYCATVKEFAKKVLYKEVEVQ